MRHQKSLGQHFLRDRSIFEKIAYAAELSRDDLVLEIGPGTGTLTEVLLQRAAEVITVEKDERLCALLNTKFSSSKNITIVCGDILRFQPARYGLHDGGYKIVANIPYYLTGRILRLIFTDWPRPKLAVLMLQKEVAERIVAKPPKTNRLAALCQYFASPKIIAIVRKGAFRPPPKVDSAIVAIWRIRPPNPRDTLVEQTIAAGFAHPRKLLITNLAARFGRQAAEAALAALSLRPSTRPAELEIAQWERLSTFLFETR